MLPYVWGWGELFEPAAFTGANKVHDDYEPLSQIIKFGKQLRNWQFFCSMFKGC